MNQLRAAAGREAPRSYQPRERLTIATTDNITGTSIRTPTTVANAAPELKPKRLIAAATASSKKFDAPINAEGPATQCCSPDQAVQKIGEAGVEIDLDQDRNGEKHDHERLRDDLFALETEEKNECRQKSDEGEWLQFGEQLCQRRLAPLCEHLPTNDLSGNNRDDNVKSDRKRQSPPRNCDGGKAEQEADDRRECENHDRVVERDLT